MSKHLNIKRILGLYLFCSTLLSITTVNVYADKNTYTICYVTEDGYVYCDYGMDMSKKNLTGEADAKSDNKWAGSREIYVGGTWDGEAYNYDGELIDKFNFEITNNSKNNAPLKCEANLYIDNGETKYCTYQISEFCDSLLYLNEDGQSPELDELKLQMFEIFDSDFKVNSNSTLTPLMTGTASEQYGCECGAEYEFMSDSQILEHLINQLVDMYSEGLLDEFDQDHFDEMIDGLLEEYEASLIAESQPVEATAQTEGENNGAEVLMIPHNNPICRIIGQEVITDEPITSCFWGHRVDATRFDKNGNEITNVKIIAFEELWMGGTYIPDTGAPYPGYGDYFFDGDFIGKFRKTFKYNDNADVFWKVEVGLNGSTLEFCSMRDQEYSDKARTKETCQSLYIDIE